MNSNLLIDNLEIITRAPNGIKLLRELILKYAVSGRLVNQDSDEGNGSDLVLKILNSRGIKVNGENEPHSDLPKNWGRAKLGEIFHLEMGQSPNSDSYNSRGDGLPFYQGKTDFGPFVPTPRFWCSSPGKVAEVGDVLLSVRAPVGPTNFADEKCCIGRGLAAVRPLGGMRTEFVLWWLRAYESQFAEMGTGTTFVAISKKNLYPFIVSIPPLAEQDRILDKINELMKFCDDLENRFSLQEKLIIAVRKSAVDAVSSAQNSKELQTAWKRIQKNWEMILGTPESIELLKSLVRELAVRGVITNHDHILQIQSNAQSGELFEIPVSWRWVKLDEVIDFVNGFAFSSGEYQTQGIGVVRMSDMKSGQIIPDHMKKVSIERFESLSDAFQVKPGEIVMGMTGATLGKPCVNRTALTFLLNQRIGKFVPRGIETEYLLLVLAYLERSFMSMSFGTGVNNLSTQQIKDSLIPLPPANEQIKIVRIVSDLFTLCDGLQTKLINAQALSYQLARSVVSAST